MTTRYYEETPCEHGDVGPHGVGVNARLIGRIDCPGGLRRELTDTEVVEAEWDGHGRAFLPFSGSSAGRYLIAPLEE